MSANWGTQRLPTYCAARSLTPVILAQCFLHLHWILPLTMGYEPTLKKLKLSLKEPPSLTPLYIRSL